MRCQLQRLGPTSVVSPHSLQTLAATEFARDPVSPLPLAEQLAAADPGLSCQVVTGAPAPSTGRCAWIADASSESEGEEIMWERFQAYFKKLEALSTEELDRSAEKLVRAEKQSVALVIAHIAEISRRKDELDPSYKNLFDSCAGPRGAPGAGAS